MTLVLVVSAAAGSVMGLTEADLSIEVYDTLQLEKEAINRMATKISCVRSEKTENCKLILGCVPVRRKRSSV